MKKIIILLIGIFFICGCSSLNIEAYQEEKPKFIIEEYFNGEIEATGFFQDRSGKIVKRIHCIIKAYQKDGVTILDEDFTYGDGTKETRRWELKKVSEGQYIGKAGDVIGEAKVQTSGFAFNAKYTLDLKLEKSTIHVKMNDWMYLVDEKTVINKTKMTKWGFYLGEVTLVMRKK